ncbi:trigger factor [Lachnospiraceae bacterium 42-17]|jgi:trigger factor|nr:trigger factor [Dorea sp.]
MKKRFAIVFAGVLASSIILAGCEASKGLETDNIKITQYKEIEVDAVQKPEEVTEEAVEERIEMTLASKLETIEITDRPVKSGDTANIDFVGKIGGEAFEGGSAEGYPLEIGSGAFIPGFEDSIIGHSIGETFDWNGSFPEDYGNADYAGKDVVFTITVNSISQSIVPELTDEFVKSVSEKSKNVKEYKAEVKKQLEKEGKENYENQLNSQVIQKVLENSEVPEYPEDEVEKMCVETIEQHKTIATYLNMEYEDYLQQNGFSIEEFEKRVENDAKESIKQTMAIKAIAEKEKIKMTDEIYEERLKEMAKLYEYEDVDAIKEAFEEEDLKDIVLKELVVEWLAEHCIQKAS